MCKKVGSEHHSLQCCADDGDDGNLLIFSIRTHNVEPMQESVFVDKVNFNFEIHTGSAVTAIFEEYYYKYFLNHPSSFILILSYNVLTINTLGIISLPFMYLPSIN